MRLPGIAVKIKPTDNTSERVRALIYFGNMDYTTALNLHESRKYITIILRLCYMRVTLLYAKVHYFNSCDFIEIT